MSACGFLFALLLILPVVGMAEDVNLPVIAVIPVFDQSAGTYDAPALIEEAEAVFLASGRFRVTDVSDHELYQGPPADQTLRLQGISSDLAVDLFMILDVSAPETTVDHGSRDSLFVTRTTTIDITGRFYTSEGSLLGSVREKRYSGEFGGGTSMDLHAMAVSGVREVALRSLGEIFPYEFSFTSGEGPLYSIPVGSTGGVEKGMVFSVLARSQGIPRSSQEYSYLQSHGIMQIMDSSPGSSTGRLIAGNIVEGTTLSAVENSAPALLSLTYSILPTEVVPGDDLTGEENETSKLINQAEFSGATGKWGLSLGGALFSGVVPRMSSIGIRGEMGTRLPLSSPSLALRLGVGFEAAFLVQNTRADSISSSANTATISGTGSLNLEWLFSARFGLHAGCVGRFGTSADNWSVTSYTGYNRQALPGELYYAEVKQPPVSFSAGLTYMVY